MDSLSATRRGRYLENAGVTTLPIDEPAGVAGEFIATRENISYLAANVRFLRHVERRGEWERPAW